MNRQRTNSIRELKKNNIPEVERIDAEKIRQYMKKSHSHAPLDSIYEWRDDEPPGRLPSGGEAPGHWREYFDANFQLELSGHTAHECTRILIGNMSLRRRLIHDVIGRDFLPIKRLGGLLGHITNIAYIYAKNLHTLPKWIMDECPWLQKVWKDDTAKYLSEPETYLKDLCPELIEQAKQGKFLTD